MSAAAGSRLRRLARSVAARKRLLGGVVCGLLVYAILPRGLHGLTRGLTAWDSGAAVFLLLSAQLFATAPLLAISDHAAAQEEGEWTIFGLTLAATALCLAAIIGEFSASKQAATEERVLRIGFVVLTLLLTWATVHVTFAFRYAHEYYSRQPGAVEVDRGLQFPQEDQPDYFDFLYFALVLGMTFQVSDVQITARKFRRLAAVHGLISFLFSTVILALTINIASSLL